MNAIGLFLADLAGRGARPNTLAAYGVDLAQLARWRWPDGDERWPLLAPADLRAYAAALPARGYGPATVARKVGSLHSFGRWLADAGYVAADPAAGLRGPSVPPAPHPALAPAALDALIAAAASGRGPLGLRDRAMVALLAATGVKTTALIALDLNDLDVLGGAVVDRGGGKRPLGDAEAPLVAYLRCGRPELGPTSRALFVNQRGDRLTRQAVWLIVRRAAARAGLPGVDARTVARAGRGTRRPARLAVPA